MRNGLYLPVLVFLGGPLQAAGPPQPPHRTAAIERGLAYLAQTQKADGTWGSGPQLEPAYSALALSAFLSAGYEPGSKKYGSVIDKAVQAILKKQQATGLFSSASGPPMYHHGIATLALAQVHGAYQGVARKPITRALDRAVLLSLQTQGGVGQGAGGWNYTPTPIGGDLSVSGWNMLALCAARDAGRTVPRANLDLAVKFVRRCRNSSDGRFNYTPVGGTTTCCTATGVLSLTLLLRGGVQDPEVRKARATLLNGSVLKDSYPFNTAYKFAQIAALGGGSEKKVRDQLIQGLVERQERDGSWACSAAEAQLGSAYATSLSVLTLSAQDRRLVPFRRVVKPEPD